MLGLTAFLMAFSIGIVIGQQGERRAMVVIEANAVGTAWLRAGFLDEPDSTSLRDLLREYVEVRLEAADDVTEMLTVITRSEEIHNELWAIMEDNVRRGTESDIMVLFALIFVSVLIVIVDLDRPQEGLLTVSQTAMSDLLRQITPSGQ